MVDETTGRVARKAPAPSKTANAAKAAPSTRKAPARAAKAQSPAVAKKVPVEKAPVKKAATAKATPAKATARKAPVKKVAASRKAPAKAAPVRTVPIDAESQRSPADYVRPVPDEAHPGGPPAGGGPLFQPAEIQSGPTHGGATYDHQRHGSGFPPANPGRPAAQPEPTYQPRPPQKSRKALIIAAVVAAVALIGAGAVAFVSSRDSRSKADFIAEADTICSAANGPVNAIVAPTSYPELGTAAKTVADTTSGQLVQLRRLDPPGGLSGANANAALAALDAIAKANGELSSATATSDDAATIKSSVDAQGAFADAKTKADEFGFRFCGVGLSLGIEAVHKGAQAVIKAGFIARAETLCRGVAREFEDVSIDDIFDLNGARFLTVFVDPVVKLVADLRLIPVPPGDEEKLNEMFAAMDQVNERARDLGPAIDAQDGDRYDAVAREMSTLSTAADARLDEYGLGVCGSNFGS